MCFSFLKAGDGTKCCAARQGARNQRSKGARGETCDFATLGDPFFCCSQVELASPIVVSIGAVLVGGGHPLDRFRRLRGE